MFVGDVSLSEMTAMPIHDLSAFIKKLKLAGFPSAVMSLKKQAIHVFDKEEE